MDDARSQSAAETLQAYPVVISLPVQWGDQDAFGHVNNVVFFRWYESARIEYFRRVLPGGEPKRDAEGLILASIQCDFRRPVTFPDTVRVGARVARIGRSSMTVEHAAYSEAQRRVVAEGVSTVVLFDYSTGAPRPADEALRGAIDALEGRRAD